MARNKMQAPPASYDSDSDEAPEMVTKQSAEEKVQKQQQKELEARAQAKAAKRKRKSKQESEEVAQLPEDVLSAVAARDEEEEEAEEVAQEEEERAKKQANLLQKKTHTRHFGNIQVQTLQSLEQTQARDLTDSAKEFVDRRFAPKRARMDLLKGHPSQFTKKQKELV